mmetsp:Transcript_11948/g.33638  ORF Transcript_11948/g.33638 Transcript_11948/m.33638 type:complete len:215 (-) Transcript_11948:658-1302(-)
MPPPPPLADALGAPLPPPGEAGPEGLLLPGPYLPLQAPEGWQSPLRGAGQEGPLPPPCRPPPPPLEGWRGPKQGAGQEGPLQPAGDSPSLPREGWERPRWETVPEDLLQHPCQRPHLPPPPGSREVRQPPGGPASLRRRAPPWGLPQLSGLGFRPPPVPPPVRGDLSQEGPRAGLRRHAARGRAGRRPGPGPPEAAAQEGLRRAVGWLPLPPGG